MEIRALVHKGATGSRRIEDYTTESRSRVFRLRIGIVGQRQVESRSERSNWRFGA